MIFERLGFMTFFKNVPGVLNLEPYNIYHVLALSVTLLLALLVFIFRNKLKNNKTDFRVRLIASIIAFSLEAGFHISNLVYHTGFIIGLIPLDLCAISLWLSLILTIWKSEFVFKILYFWGIGGLISLLYPDINGIGPDKMRYYHFFAVHSYIVLCVLYFMIVYKYKINLRSLANAILVLFPITLLVHFIDLHFYGVYKTNWMFLASPPDISSILDYLPKGGWLYYFSFVLLGIFVFVLFYLPWGIAKTVSMKAKVNKPHDTYSKDPPYSA